MRAKTYHICLTTDNLNSIHQTCSVFRRQRKRNQTTTTDIWIKIANTTVSMRILLPGIRRSHIGALTKQTILIKFAKFEYSDLLASRWRTSDTPCDLALDCES